MNLQEIIESGLIELYAMNALSEAETAHVEAWAIQFPEVRAEIDEVQAALELYAQAHAVEPSAGMKAKILANFEADLGGKSREKNEKKTENLVENPEKRPLSITPEKADSRINFGQKLPWAIAAIALIAAIAGFWKASNTQKQLSDCQTESTQLVQKQQVIVDLEHKMNILKSPDTKPVKLNGLPISKQSQVVVYWNAKEKATLLTILDLPKPPQGKQYQLWAIEGDNPPVDAGMIAYDLTMVQPMKAFDKVNTFAITLENEGGSLVPTLDQMYVLGAIL